MQLLGATLLALVIFDVVLETKSTKCRTTTDKTCRASLLVKAACADSGECECETNHVPTRTGCAAVQETTPTVSAGVYSGEVFATPSLNGTLELTCNTDGPTTSFSWYQEGVKMAATSQKITVTVTDGFDKFITCKSVSGEKLSNSSEPFRVKAYKNDGIISQRPVVQGLPAKALSNTTLNARCTNLPKDKAGIEYQWKNMQSSYANRDLPVVVKSPGTKPTDGKDVACHIAPKGSRTVTILDAESENRTVTTAVRGIQVQAEVRVEPENPLVGGYMAVTCLVYAPTTVGLTYRWFVKGVPLTGQNDHTLQIDGLVESDSGVYTCEVGFDDINKNTSEQHVSVSKEQKERPNITPSSNLFGEGNSYTLTCISGSQTPGMTYRWFKGTQEVRGQTDQQYVVVATATDTTYSCETTFLGGSIRSEEFSVKGEKITEVHVDGVQYPVIGTATSYTCLTETGASVSDRLTYRWLRETGGYYNGHFLDTSFSSIGGNVKEYNAKIGSGTFYLRCTVEIGKVDKKSDRFKVTPQDSPLQPVVTSSDAASIGGGTLSLSKGARHLLSCDSDSSTPDATYEWRKGTTILVAGAQTNTYTIDKADLADAGSYTCSITVEGKTNRSTIMDVIVENKKGKPCSPESFGFDCKGQAYSGNCIDGRCECSATGTLVPNDCSLPIHGHGSNSSSITGSILLVLIAVLGSFLQ